MRSFVKTFVFKTERTYELIDITRSVEEVVRESGIKNGICLVYAPHATAAVVVNEHERGLMEDILRKIEEEFPRDGKWKHNIIDDNAAAHLGSVFLSTSKVFPVINGELIRGTWQNIFLVEMDGPRSRRRVLVQVLGE
ncbi:YjbQ family protein [Candidatus Geothermarchaeota archaeon]|nr:MAG: YjbQ family protein [Candidatus Geothermarchaeota archaeon]